MRAFWYASSFSKSCSVKLCVYAVSACATASAQRSKWAVSALRSPSRSCFSRANFSCFFSAADAFCLICAIFACHSLRSFWYWSGISCNTASCIVRCETVGISLSCSCDCRASHFPCIPANFCCNCTTCFWSCSRFDCKRLSCSTIVSNTASADPILSDFWSWSTSCSITGWCTFPHTGQGSPSTSVKRNCNAWLSMIWAWIFSYSCSLCCKRVSASCSFPWHAINSACNFCISCNRISPSLRTRTFSSSTGTSVSNCFPNDR